MASLYAATAPARSPAFSAALPRSRAASLRAGSAGAGGTAGAAPAVPAAAAAAAAILERCIWGQLVGG